MTTTSCISMAKPPSTTAKSTTGDADLACCFVAGASPHVGHTSFGPWSWLLPAAAGDGDNDGGVEALDGVLAADGRGGDDRLAESGRAAAVAGNAGERC